jgi:hypothetical protein
VLKNYRTAGEARFAGLPWTNYPDLSSGDPRLFRWLVVKAKYSDDASVPAGLDHDINHFLGLAGSGFGNIPDYFHDVSYNAVSVFGAAFTDWVDAPFATGNARGIKRIDRVQACLDAVPAEQLPDMDDYYGVIVVMNVPVDGGAANIGPATLTVGGQQYPLGAVIFDAASLWTGFAVEEISHGLGMDHSFDNTGGDCTGRPGEYCDPWDAMSALQTFMFSDPNWPFADGTPGLAGPGFVTANLLRQGWLPGRNVVQFQFSDDGSPQTFVLHALSHAREDSKLVVVIDMGGPGPFDGVYTVEYRQADGWDQGFANSVAAVTTAGGAVLVHLYREAGAPAATLIDNANRGAWLPGDTAILTNTIGQTRSVRVDGFDTASGTATITVL